MINLIIKHSFRLKLVVVLLLFVVLYSCKKEYPGLVPLSKAQHPLKQSGESADVVYQWYDFMAALQQLTPPQPPFNPSRSYAYIGIGLFESVQPGIAGGSSFGSKLLEMPTMPKPDHSKEYLWSASANAAMSSLIKLFLNNLTPADRTAIDANEAAIRNQLSSMTAEDVLQRSEAFGRSIATAIYNWANTDNFHITNSNVLYTPINEPWAWAPAPPALLAAVGDSLQYTRPLLKYSLTATAPPIPIPFSEDPGSAFYNAVKEVNDLGGATTATPDNKATANWWADVGGLTAPYHILSIITTVLKSQDAGLWKAAEVYAKTGIALKDGPIIVFRAKYQYNLLRPITYIQRHIDATWFSYLGTPPYPEYSSGLVGFYGPVTQVLINEFGDIPVTDDTYGYKGVPARPFSSLSQMRLEAAMSRVYAGIHYRFTQMVSIDMGIDLANEIDKVRVVGPEYQ